MTHPHACGLIQPNGADIAPASTVAPIVTNTTDSLVSVPTNAASRYRASD